MAKAHRLLSRAYCGTSGSCLQRGWVYASDGYVTLGLAYGHMLVKAAIRRCSFPWLLVT